MSISEINVEQLVKPVSKENPIGEKLPIYDLRRMAEGEPKRQWEPAVPPNWKNVYRTSQKYLREGKDLWGIHFLTLSAMELYEFEGLIKGLDLMKQMLEKYWDDIPPLLDSDTEEEGEFCIARLSTISSLCVRGGHLYQKIISMPIIKTARLGNFSFKELQGIADELGVRKKEHEGIELNHIYAEVKGEDLDKLLNQFNKCLELFTDIDKFLDEKVGPEFNRSRAKDMIDLFSEMLTLFKEKLIFQPVESEEFEEETSDVTSESKGKTSANPLRRSGKLISNEKDVIRVFNEVSRWYKDNHPMSPVPFALSKVIDLVGKDFMEIMGALTGNESLEIKTSFNAKVATSGSSDQEKEYSDDKDTDTDEDKNTNVKNSGSGDNQLMYKMEGGKQKLISEFRV